MSHGAWNEDPYGPYSGLASPPSPYFHNGHAQHQPPQHPEQTRLVQGHGGPTTIKRKPIPGRGASSSGLSPNAAAAAAAEQDRRFTPSPLSERDADSAPPSQMLASKQHASAHAEEMGATAPPAWLGQTTKMKARWRPQYLRRWVFVAFICFFLACMIIIEAMLAVSDQKDGLSSPGLSLYYLWTFGPTSVIILVATLWTRVEFQMMRYMPWIAMSRRPEPAAQTILVDYVSMFSLKAIWKAMKHNHLVLFMALVTALLFKVQIVLSTSLLSLQETDLAFEVWPVTLQRDFKDIPSVRPPNTSLYSFNIPSIPFILLQASRNLGLRTPDGFVDGIAYQTFEAPGLDPSAQLSVGVNAFTMDVDCIDAEMTFNDPRLIQSSSFLPDYEFHGNFTLKTDTCTDVFSWGRPSVTNSCATRSDANLADLWYLDDISRQLLIPQGPTCFPKGTFLTARATFEHQTTNSNSSLCNNTAVIATKSTAVVCMPKYSVFRATVERNATSVHSIQPHEPREWKPLGDLDDIFRESLLRSPDLFAVIWRRKPPRALGFGYDILVGRTSANSTGTDVQFDSETIKQSMRKTQQYVGAMFANTFLTDPAATNTTGTARLRASRLVVHPVTSHVMVGLFGLMLLFAAAMLLAAPRHLAGFAPRDPNTVVGTAALLANSHEFRESFHQSAHEGARHLERRFGTATYRSGYGVAPQTQRPTFVVAKASEKEPLLSPARSGRGDATNVDYYWAWCLHPAAQVTALLVLIGLIAALIGLLQVSQRNDGIADLTGRDETYLHYLWTSLPTLVMVGISLFFSACNFETRLVVPFSRMKAAPRQDFRNTVGLTYLDELSVSTLFRMTNARNGSRSVRVLLMTLMSLLAGVLTILTSTLYHSRDAGADVAIQLQQQQWFAQELNNATLVEPGLFLGNAEIPDLLASMAVGWGLDYPKWTYEDIVFPSLGVEPLPAGRPVPTSIRAKVPAVQPELANCSLHLQTDDLRLDYTDVDPRYRNVRLKVSVGDRCFFRVRDEDIPYREQFGLFRSSVYPANYIDSDGTCADAVFFWGARKFSDPRDFAAVLLCNESASFVDVDATFKYPSMLVDSTNPPVPDESTRRPYGPGKLRSGPVHGYVANVLPPPDTLDTSPITFNVSYDYAGFEDPGFFYLLVGGTNGNTRNRLGSLPLSAFRGPDTADEVATAVKKAYNTLRTQTISLGNATRLNFTQESRFAPFRQTAPAPIAATATLPARRLVQEPLVTWLLVAALALILVLHACTLWPQDRRVVPNNPMAIAVAASLLADSDIFDRLPAEGAELASDEELERAFEGKVFRMGWFDDVKDPTSQTFTIRMFDAAVNEKVGPERDLSYLGSQGVVVEHRRPVAQPGGAWFPVQGQGWSSLSQDDHAR